MIKLTGKSVKLKCSEFLHKEIAKLRFGEKKCITVAPLLTKISGSGCTVCNATLATRAERKMERSKLNIGWSRAEQ